MEDRNLLTFHSFGSLPIPDGLAAIVQQAKRRLNAAADFLAEGKQLMNWTDAPTYDLRISTQAPKTDNGRLTLARARAGTGIGDVPVLTLP